ncbi:MAG: TRAP transporter substrate-binding protein DctP [Syntrophales bacterium]|jgi:TRAP-type mannitol/chloroaromatic compound transport system substrate-binding protein|nr:TRAP transporter substrate-binding protein DctP [Syntrophales bacterium]
MADKKKKDGVTRRDFVKGAAAGFGGAAAVLGFPGILTAQSKPIRWRLQGYYPSTASAGKYGPLWAKSITELTGGRLTVEYSEPGAIVPVGESFQNVADGTIDACQAFANFYRGIFPETDIEAGLPFAWETPFEMHDAYYNRGLLEEIRKIYAEHNILYCCPCYGNLIYGFSTVKPIRKAADMKGMKIRDLGLSADWVASYGASPTSLPAGEMYMALKMKTIDGVHYGVAVLEDLKIGEVCKYFLIEPNTGTCSMNLFCSMKSYNKLPNDLKKIVKDYSLPLVLPAVLSWDEKRSLAEISKKYGVEAVRWPKAEVDKGRAFMIEKLWPKVASKSARCKKLVDLVVAQAKHYGKI